jgi:6-phosphogluconolactonase
MTVEQIEIYRNPEALARAAADRFRRVANAALKAAGIFTVALSGGNTLKALYSLLGEDPDYRKKLPWDKTFFFFGDERHVPPDHAESNFRLAQEALFSKIAIPAGNIHRILAENSNAAEASSYYERDLRSFFGERDLVTGGAPVFDLIFLGTGPDGHTASLFPGSAALNETGKWVTENWVEELKSYRITVTYPVLNNAVLLIVLVAGVEKAPIIENVLEKQSNSRLYPIQGVMPRFGPKLWLLDEAAASRLSSRVRNGS